MSLSCPIIRFRTPEGMNRRIYLFNSGTLHRRANTLRFVSGDVKKTIPVEQVQEIFVFGEVKFSRKLLEFLMLKGIVMHVFSYGGHYLGTFFPLRRKGDSFYIVKQVEKYLDPSERLNLARSFVRGAINNMISILRSRKVPYGRLSRLLPHVERTKGIPGLMSVEGEAWETYYLLWNDIIQDEYFRFRSRTRRPPSDPINALIGFGNSLMYSLLVGYLFRVGLDPRIGYLHSVKKRVFSLNLDMAELFKPLVVNRVIFNLISWGRISPVHFTKKGDGVYLTQEGRKIFVRSFEEMLRSTFKVNKERKMSYHGFIKWECERLKSAIMNDEVYEPVKLELA